MIPFSSPCRKRCVESAWMTEWRRRRRRGIVMFPDWRYRSEEEEEENGHDTPFLSRFFCVSPGCEWGGGRGGERGEIRFRIQFEIRPMARRKHSAFPHSANFDPALYYCRNGVKEMFSPFAIFFSIRSGRDRERREKFSKLRV